MQIVLVENLALTFVGDAHAFAAGFGRILVKIISAPIARMAAPIEQIARACDVAGVLPAHGAKADVLQFHSRERVPSSSQRPPRRCLFPFRSLNHLT
jgi:hypothetical protein